MLRVNFRGVNLSEGQYDHGHGETDDARTALRELETRYPHLPISAGGFSFGSRVALRLTSEESSIKRVIAVGFPTRITERDFVYSVNAPKYFVHSTHDEFGPRPDFEAFYETVPEPKQLNWIESTDHFFKDALDAYEAVIIQIGQERKLS